jgi:excinuclease ABC subunit C
MIEDRGDSDGLLPDFSQQSPAESSTQPSTINQPACPTWSGRDGDTSAYCKELQRLGLFHQPIIGLAKEFEEIYRPGRPLPLRLPEDSGALKLLQRIRDEAHRFANSFHSLLLKKRISESVLDEIPGVSQSRKKALLEAFGSVERIRKSSTEEISSVSGIGPGGEQIRYIWPARKSNSDKPPWRIVRQSRSVSCELR